MLSVQDMENLLGLISSPRLSVSGAEIMTVAVLQQNLRVAIATAKQPQPVAVPSAPPAP